MLSDIVHISIRISHKLQHPVPLVTRLSPQFEHLHVHLRNPWMLEYVLQLDSLNPIFLEKL